MRYLITLTILLVVTFAGCNEPIEHKSEIPFLFQEWNGPRFTAFESLRDVCDKCFSVGSNDE